MLKKIMQWLLNSNSPSLETDLALWLKKEGISVHQISETHWNVDVEHDKASYSVTLKKEGGWLTYGAELMSDVEGERLDEFYQSLLSINAALNGAYIARQGDSLILLRNEFSKDITEDSIAVSIGIFNATHEYLYDKVIKNAGDLNLKIKKKAD